MTQARPSGRAGTEPSASDGRAEADPVARDAPIQAATESADVLDDEHDAAGGQQVESADAADPAEPTRRRHSQLLLPVVLGVATVLLGGFAAFAGARAHSLTTGAGQNAALSDNATTTKIIGEVTTAVGDIFSYSYADPARTQRAGQRELTGQAVQQYRTLYRNLQREGGRYSQLVLTTTVTDAGVEVLQGNSARVLVFANQVLTSAGQTPQSFGAMVALDVVQQAGTWKIENIDTFTGAR